MLEQARWGVHAGGNDKRAIRVNSVELRVQTFGSPQHPTMLLISGATASMDCWDEDFCQILADNGRFVIRYDNRDTGGSTRYELGSAPYGLDDLVADAVGLLDTLGVVLVHVVGASMGGAIAQRLAIEHPDRVASLALIATSPGLRPGVPRDPDLPPVAPQVRSQYVNEPPMHNHAMIDPGAPYRPHLYQISAPTLVIHGADDSLFPLRHGEALAEEIPAARLLPLAGIGHEVPPLHTWGVVIPALLNQTSSCYACTLVAPEQGG